MLEFYVIVHFGINNDKLYIFIKISSPAAYCASIYVRKLIAEVCE